MIIEGKNAIIEALKAETKIEKIIIDDSKAKGEYNHIFNLAREKGVKVNFSGRFALQKIAKSKNCQGIIAQVSDYDYKDIFVKITKLKEEGKNIFLLVLDGIEDPHNLGAIIRVAECAGVDGIVIGKDRACPVNDTVIKVSAGAIYHMDVDRVTNINDAIRKIKENNIFVYGADMTGNDIYKSNLKGDIAIVIGNEGKGLHALTRKLCDEIISLPQLGKINSLNASVATGAVLYEAVRQRL